MSEERPCGHRDRTDLGVVQGKHVFLCKECGAFLAIVEYVSVITDSRLLDALTPGRAAYPKPTRRVGHDRMV